MTRKAVDPRLLGLVGPYAKLAATMSRNWGVEIIPSGYQCSYDGKRIRIPFTSDHLSESMKPVLDGMVDHETLHAAEDITAVEAGRARPSDIFKNEKDKKVRWLANVFEDVRIEEKYSSRYPGMAENLRAHSNHSIKKGAALRATGKLKPNVWRDLGIAIIATARKFEHPPFDPKIQRLIDLIKPEMDLIETLEWGSDSFDLARIVKEKVEKFVEDSAPEEKVEGAGGEGAGIPDEMGDPTESDPTDWIRDEIEVAARKEAKEHKRYVPDPRMAELDKFIRPDIKHGWEADYKIKKDDMASQIGAIRAKQTAYIQTITRSRVVGGLDEGVMLDPASLASSQSGNEHVYAGLIKGKSVNTAIEVLIDLSGSMSVSHDRRCAAYWASRTAIALAEGWESIGLPDEFIGFHNNHYRWVVKEKLDGTVNRAPFDYYILKGWNERLARCRHRFCHIEGHHDNVDGEAVWMAALRLATRRERRKILVVISDGQPAHNDVDFTVLHDHLREVVKRVTSAGIEVLGVGAGTDAPRFYYNESTGAKNLVIDRLETMATTLFSAMREKLIHGLT